MVIMGLELAAVWEKSKRLALGIGSKTGEAELGGRVMGDREAGVTRSWGSGWGQAAKSTQIRVGLLRMENFGASPYIRNASAFITVSPAIRWNSPAFSVASRCP